MYSKVFNLFGRVGYFRRAALICDNRPTNLFSNDSKTLCKEANCYRALNSLTTTALQDTAFVTQKENLGIGDQVLNRAAKIGLSSQLHEAENMNLNIQEDLLKGVQRKDESVPLKGEGLVCS